MKLTSIVLAAALTLTAMPLAAQDNELGEIMVTAQRRQAKFFVEARPVVGLRRQADSAVQTFAITSDSRDAAMRRREVEAMLMASLDRAQAAGLSLVTGQFELVEVTRANYRDLVFGAVGDAADDEDDDGDSESRPAGFRDYGGSAELRLMVKARLAGSTGDARARIEKFTKGVPATGRSLIELRGGLGLTIVNPDQYRDAILQKVSEAALHHAQFFGPGYGVETSGLDKDVAWAQVSNTDVFLYIPYSFTVKPK